MKNYPTEKTAVAVTKLGLCGLLAPLLLLAVGCHRDQVQVYRVANDQDQPPQQAAPMAPVAQSQPTNSVSPALPPEHPDLSSMPPGAEQPGAAPLTWKTPAGWQEVAPSEMRLASFKIAGADGKQADVSVIPLPGMAGGDDANVNRWRGQVGLQPAPDDELQKSAESVQTGGQPAQLYDIIGQNPTTGQPSRILAVIQHRDNTAWFFKMTGDPDLVGQQKAAFVEFLSSLAFPAAQVATELPPGHPAIGDMAASGANPGPISHEGQPNWQVPAGWQEVSGGQFLVAKFVISGNHGVTAAVNVSASTGDGGGLAANVNRWRGQLGLSPASEPSTTPIDVAGGQAQLVDISGTDARTGKPAELVGIVFPQGERTWFYKLMGDPSVVAAQKDAFTQFVKGAQY